MSEEAKKLEPTPPTVDFREYVNAPWSREQIRRLQQLPPVKEGEPRRPFPPVTLTHDAVGILAKSAENVCIYPWGTVACATNVPRAK